ncbi:AEC family transporter [Hasllibacter halocynthiae]|uniref:AEC family transporter n=1 Tax=Hasllibacter halocynthiae TaxID=595589 RepID=UPI001FEA76E2|nr:AEC family transporter [Hasllibacter halocynthiae]
MNELPGEIAAAIPAVAAIVAPVLALAATGWLWVRAGWDYPLAFVTRLAMTLALPCLIFTALVRTQVEPAALAALTLASLAAYGGVLAAFWAIGAALGLDRRTFLPALAFGNTGNLGLPLALFAFGETGLQLAVVVFAVMVVLSFTAGVWLVAGGGPPGRALREPLVAATLLGALFLWRGWDLPAPAMATLDLLGQLAIPLMLITLGVAVARLRPAGIGRSLALSVLKLVLCTAVAWAAASAFGLGPTASAVLVVQIGTPVAVTSYMLALKYGADAEAVAGLVVTSTLLSVAALPLILAVLI